MILYSAVGEMSIKSILQGRKISLDWDSFM